MAVANLSQLRAPQQPNESTMPSVSVGLTNLQSFELAQRAAKVLAASTLVPKEYIGNLPNCIIALNMAGRIGADPLMVMQNLVIVHGRPTWSSQFLIATFNSCGRFSAIRYEFFGERNTDSWGCHAVAIEKSSGERLIGTDITIALAKKEGWYSKNGSKWQSMPQQMLMYRAASWLVRAYAPELSMGLHTVEEVGDVYEAQQDSSGSYSVTVDSLREAASPVIDESAVTEPQQQDEQPAIEQKQSHTAADIAAFEAQERERLAAEQKQAQPTAGRRSRQQSMPME